MADGHADDTGRGAVGELVPTRTRFALRRRLCLLAAILYLDRVGMASALDSIQRDLGLTNTQCSYVLMAFTVAYGLFELPTGRWGDRVGGRRVLTRITLWWSAFTVLTGACQGLWTLVSVRFLFGAGEAGALPNAARVISRWFPPAERGRAQGAMLASTLAGAAVTPFLAALTIRAVGWRWTFAAFGATGLVWAAAFWRWFRDDPAEHPDVNAAEADRIGRLVPVREADHHVPWAAVLRHPSVWLLGLATALSAFNTYIYFSWFPKYLKSGRAVADTEAGLMGSVVLGLAAGGTIAGGILVDRIARGGGGLASRRVMGAGAFFAAAALLMGALASSDPWLATFFTGLSCGAAQLTQPLWWSCATEVSGRHVGALSGLMNSMGVCGALASQFLVGALADALLARGFTGRAQWDPIFRIDVGVMIAAGLLWCVLRPTPVEPSRATPKPQPEPALA